ncbi:PREDICTED: transcription factor GTE2-like [Ipomoea nil]|uniref:transcription factor GTE2-like n=1 Tax=Ipomoea nil TaxID=35883 RepID=UPI000901FB9A|nr:PREDICTED: transcription factor GTE2-like [Ipomoea nil]XP_019154879.1 PREDICTED: transcription factor GTE2-like [Ipomoea nil]
MASAVLASRNEPHWSERKLCMSEFNPNSTTNNPHFYGRINPNPNPSHCSFNPSIRAGGSNFDVAAKRIHEGSTKPQRRHFNHQSQRSVPPLPEGLIDRNGSFHREYVTFNLGSYSRREIKELKQRLIFDLERVQGVLKKLETIEFETRASFHGLQRGEAPEPPSPPKLPQLPQPPRLQVNQPGVEILPENQAPNGLGHHFQSSGVSGAKNKGKSKPPGKKRAFPDAAEGDHKRKEAKLDGAAVSMMRRCAQILTKLMKHKFGWVFNSPVDTKGLGLHDYHVIIKHPMDLGTVKSRLDSCQYETPLQFAGDVRLTFKNAMIYNPKGQDVHAMAELLLKNFDDMFTAAYRKYEAEHKKAVAAQKNVRPQPERIVASRSPEPMLIAKSSDMGSLLSTSLDPPQHLSTLSNSLPVPNAPVFVPAEKPSLQPLVPTRSGKLPKPKAKDPNKRQMTFEEKARLGIDLQNLPQDKMEHMMQILRRRNSSVSTEGDEIELDIEALDNETLWELDRFVGYQKKALSKMMRQGLIPGASQENIIAEALGENVSNFPGNVATPNPVEHTDKKDEADEEDVDIGEESPINNFSPVKIEKDVSRSSSSSSSSDSSSSDSDSGSSCGSDSDEDSVQLQETSKM